MTNHAFWELLDERYSTDDTPAYIEDDLRALVFTLSQSNASERLSTSPLADIAFVKALEHLKLAALELRAAEIHYATDKTGA